MIFAFQYWQGDEAALYRLVRLVVDLETEIRFDVHFALVRRFDVRDTPALDDVLAYVRKRFPSCEAVKSTRAGSGRYAGPNELWAFTMDYFASKPEFSDDAVFTAEADGVPLRRNWMRELVAEHCFTRSQGKAITGSLTTLGCPPHINGNRIMDTAFWRAHPEMHATPGPEPYDIYHRGIINPNARAIGAIMNDWGQYKLGTRYIKDLADVGVAWFHGCKDQSAYARARVMLLGDLSPGELAMLLAVPSTQSPPPCWLMNKGNEP